MQKSWHFTEERRERVVPSVAPSETGEPDHIPWIELRKDISCFCFEESILVPYPQFHDSDKISLWVFKLCFPSYQFALFASSNLTFFCEFNLSGTGKACSWFVALFTQQCYMFGNSCWSVILESPLASIFAFEHYFNRYSRTAPTRPSPPHPIWCPARLYHSQKLNFNHEEARWCRWRQYQHKFSSKAMWPAKWYPQGQIHSSQAGCMTSREFQSCGTGGNAFVAVYTEGYRQSRIENQFDPRNDACSVVPRLVGVLTNRPIKGAFAFELWNNFTNNLD